MWGELCLRAPPFCVASVHPHMFDPSLSHRSWTFKTLWIWVRPNSVPWSGVSKIRDKGIPHVELGHILHYHHLPICPNLLQPDLKGLFCECIFNHCFIVNCFLRMFHSSMLQKRKCILVQVIPNLHERHILINIFFHLVSFILWAEIVDITNRWRHGLTVNDPSTLLCGLFWLLIIRCIVTFIVTWKEGRHNVVISSFYGGATTGNSTGFSGEDTSESSTGCYGGGTPVISPRNATVSRDIRGGSYESSILGPADSRISSVLPS